MTHTHGRPNRPPQQHEIDLANLLDLETELMGAYFADLAEWVAEQAPPGAQTLVDLGAGTGGASLAIARSLDVDLLALDRSAVMLERLQAAAHALGLGRRVCVARADLDGALPELRDVDIVFASASLHEVAGPDRLLGEVHSAMSPGGLLVIVEMDGLPRFLPDDLQGFEDRCHEALAQAHWNHHPDWTAPLKRAGFDFIAQRGFTIEAPHAGPATGRYAHGYMTRMRGALDPRLSAEDLSTLERLVTVDHPEGVLHGDDLTVRATRTAWAARKP